MSNTINILSTKTLSKTQKEVLENNNFNVFEVDFIKTATTNFDLKDINENLIFTSQNAVHSVLANPNCESLKTERCFSSSGTNNSVSPSRAISNKIRVG